MFSAFEWKLAYKYFKAKKNEKFLSVISGFSLIGVMIGVAALIIVMAVMNGFRIELTKKIIGLNSDIIISSFNVKEEGISDYSELIDNIKKYKFVNKIYPLISGQALATSNYASSGVIIKALNEEDLKDKSVIFNNIKYGSLENFNDDDSIAVGQELAYSLGVNVGDELKLTAPKTLSTIFGQMPISKTFKVIAIFSSGMYDYDIATLIMPLKSGQVFYHLPEQINQIEIYSVNPDISEIYTKDLINDLGDKYKIMDWKTTHANFFHALKIERVAMFTILSLIIIVAAFNIVSGLIILVRDKTKDIAILRTIGASKGSILRIFIINGMMIGVIGTSLGVTLGVLIASNIERVRRCLEKFSGTELFDAALYFLYALPSHIIPSDVIKVGLTSLFLCMIATLYPSFRAASLDPVEAMRYE